MHKSDAPDSVKRAQALNAVPLRNAVLCAECDVVSDSPHDVCMVCGSRSLFNIARVFGGQLPRKRTNMIAAASVPVVPSHTVLVFPQRHRIRRRAVAGVRQLPLVPLDGNEPESVEAEALAGPKGR